MAKSTSTRGRRFELPPAVLFAPVDQGGLESFAARGLLVHDHEEDRWVHPVTKRNWCAKCYPPNHAWIALHHKHTEDTWNDKLSRTWCSQCYPRPPWAQSEEASPKQ